MEELPFWCYSEYYYYTIETDSNGTSIKVNTNNFDIPYQFLDCFDFSLEQHAKIFNELKLQYGEQFPKFFEETEDIGEIRSTDPREIVETAHELIDHLFSHDIKQWSIRQYESFDEANFKG